MGDVSSRKTIVLFGDSHARAWIPAIENIAKRAHLKAYYLVKPGCNAAQTAVDYGHGVFEDCLDWRNWAIAAMTRMHPDVLLVTSDLPEGISGDNGQQVKDLPTLASDFKEGLERSLAELRPYVGRIVVMGDVPGLQQPADICLSTRGVDLGDCAYPRSWQSRLTFKTERAVAADGGYEFVNTIPWFCAHNVCPSVVGSTVTYRDVGHITTEYARQLAKPLQDALELSASRQ